MCNTLCIRGQHSISDCDSMATLPRRHKPYLDVQDHHAEAPSVAGPSQPSKRYSTLSTRSALTADTPSTPPRTPSPSAYRHLEVPVTALAGVRLEADGSKERESRSLRRARSAERTRTWAEEVERQRLKAERRTGTKGRTLAEKWAGEEAVGTCALVESRCLDHTDQRDCFERNHTRHSR